MTASAPCGTLPPQRHSGCDVAPRKEPPLHGNLLEQDPALAEVVTRLIEAYQPERIYLFGSRARGDVGPDSDYDLLVIVPDSTPSERRRSRLAYEVLWGTGTAADVVVWPRSLFEERQRVPASLAATAIREGKLLHAA